MTKKIFIGIQSRLTSQRFPQKSLTDILGLPLIIRVIQRIQKISYPYKIVLLCPIQDISVFENLLTKYELPIPVLGGSSDDVLSRYYQAALHFDAHDMIMRVTGDNPLISVPLADLIIQHHLENQSELSHFLSNPLGTGVEIVNFDVLKRLHHNVQDPEYREHVTLYCYHHKELFRIAEPESPYLLPKYPHLSIDTPQDKDLVLSLLEQDPEWEFTNYAKKSVNS